MKLRIVHQNQESREAEEQVRNKESEETEEGQIGASMEDEFVDKNSPPLDPPPVSAHDSMLVFGKRERKPKQIVDDVSFVIRRKRKSTSSNNKHVKMQIIEQRTLHSGGKSTRSRVDLKSPTMIRAEEVQSNLGHDEPTFLKALVRSHVATCFWMGLPVPFCKLHLPMKDTMAVLENEVGEEFSVKYIANKTGLSAGWKKFVSGNKLLEGDVLVFQLIGPCRFKVHIVRANDLTEVDGALSLLILDSQTKQNDADKTVDAHVKKKRRRKSLPLTAVQKRKEDEGPLTAQPEETSGNDSDEVASEVLEGSKFSGTPFDFKQVKSFEEFRVLVNGVCIDPDIPEHIRRKYYELCCSKNSFLHDCLLPGLYSKLAAGMIVEVVSIADAVRGCTLTTPRTDFEVWEKSLRSFELLGLSVGFIRARLQHLIHMAYDSEDAVDTRRYWEVQMDRSRVEDDIQTLEAKLVELKELSAKFGHEIENLKVKAESYQLMFQGEANATW